MKNQKPDLPKSIVVILVILAVIISVIGTWSVLNEIDRLRAVPRRTIVSGTQQGKVAIVIKEPREPQTSLVTGNVAITIQKLED